MIEVDWNDERIPNAAMAIAMDSDGLAWAHDRHPRIGHNVWLGGSIVHLDHLDNYADDWTKSLVIRPGAEGEAGPADAAEHDPVNRPSHYTGGGIECIDAIEAALGTRGALDYCRGCAIKYHWRMLDKNGAEDARKAAWYSGKAAELMEKLEGEHHDD